MSQVYVVIPLGPSWEDLIVFLNEYDAKNYSLNHPNNIVRLFVQNKDLGYYPTEKYYLNGIINLPL